MSESTAALRADIEGLLGEAGFAGSFNGVVLVAKRNEILAERAYGLANRSWAVPNRVDTVFRFASITKFLTAVLVMRLVEENLVDLGASLLSYLPDYRQDTGSRITVHHLLSHTSGLTHYPTAAPGFMLDAARRPHDRQEFARIYCSGDLASEPGERFGYSNDSYHLLGLVVEAVTGGAYEDALARRVLAPAGMTGTGFVRHETIVPQLASGYDWADDHYANAPFVEMSVPWAAGGLIGTVGDLFRLHRALDSGLLLRPASLDRMFSPHATRGAEPVGYGCILSTFEGHQVIVVPGSLPGFDNMLWFHRPSASFVALLSNVWGRRPTGVPGAILKRLVD